MRRGARALPLSLASDLPPLLDRSPITTRRAAPAADAAPSAIAPAEHVRRIERHIASNADLFLVVEAAPLQRVDEAERHGVAALEVVRGGKRGDLLGMDAGVEERVPAKERGHART